MDTQTIINDLNKLYGLINKQIFNNELENVELTISPKGKRNAYGWFTLAEAWSSNKHEINLCAEYLDRGAYDITSTLIHEMVHLYNHSKDIMDCSRNSTFHNKKFKNEAEKRHLITEYSKKYGYSHTKLSDKGKAIIDSFNLGDAFTIKRLEISASATKKNKSKKYTCPNCNISVRATKEISLICGKCYEDTEEVTFLELSEGDEP